MVARELTAAPEGDRPEPPAAIWRRPYRALTVGLVLTVSAAAFEALAVATTMPATARELGGLALYGWAFSAFMLTNLVGITLAGAEADRGGPARPFAAGVALFTGGLVIAGLAPSMPVVILGRAVQGAGAGAIGSIAYVAVGRGYPPAARPRMLAVLSTAWVVPGLVGPGLAGLVAGHFGWRWVFLGLAPFPPAAALLALPALRRLGRVAAEPRDWTRAQLAVRLAAGTALFEAGLAGQAPPVAAALLLAGAALALPALRRLLPPGTLRGAAGLPAGIAAAGLLNMALFGVDAFVPLALTAVRGLPLAAAGLPLTAATLGWTGGAWLQSHYAQRAGRRLLVWAGLAAIALGIAAMLAVLGSRLPAALASPAWAVAGLGMGMAFSTTSLVVLEAAPAGQEGAASGALQLANVTGSALSTGVGGILIGRAGAAAAAVGAGFLAQSLLMLAVAALAALAAARMPDRPPEKD